MTRFKNSCIAAAMLAALSACASNVVGGGTAFGPQDARAAARDVGPVETRTLDVRDFTAIDLAGCDSVTIAFGPAFAATATGAAGNLDTLRASVSGGELRLRRVDQSCNGERRGNGIAITMPRLEAVAISGAGRIAVAPLEAGRFAAKLSGAGKLGLDAVRAREIRVDMAGAGEVRLAGVDTRRLSLKVSGAGVVEAAGRADQLAIDSSGAADIDTRSLDVPTVAIGASGAGHIRARADRTASISASGIADVEVSGGAACTVQRSGRASVTCS